MLKTSSRPLHSANDSLPHTAGSNRTMLISLMGDMFENQYLSSRCWNSIQKVIWMKSLSQSFYFRFTHMYGYRGTCVSSIRLIGSVSKKWSKEKRKQKHFEISAALCRLGFHFSGNHEVILFRGNPASSFKIILPEEMKANFFYNTNWSSAKISLSHHGLIFAFLTLLVGQRKDKSLPSCAH